MTSPHTPPPIPPAWPNGCCAPRVRDAEWRDAVTGDLREEFASLAASRGAGRRARAGTGARRCRWPRGSPPGASCRR